MKYPHVSKLSQVFAAFAALALAVGTPAIVLASCSDPGQDSCSSNYGVSQTHFGSGGQLGACSTNYCSDQSAGDLGVGNTAAGSYQAQAGSGLTIHRDPYIEVDVSAAANPDLGVLTATSTAATYATFSVKTYLASGYQVQIVSPPPSIGGASPHSLTPMQSGGGSASPGTGTEQFGINLVSNSTNPNTNPDGYTGATLGADPGCSPDSTFCPTSTQTASIAAHYNTANKYYYPSGPGYTDTLASAATSTGTANYTISFVFNISSVTPAGQYVYNGVIVATSTF